MFFPIKRQKLFIESYTNVYDAVYRYLRFRLSNEIEAQDLTSEIFLQAWKKLKTFDSTKGTIEQWVMGIANHALIDYWRHRGRNREILFDEAKLIENEPTQDTSPFVAIDVRLLLEKLNSQERSLLVFRFLDERSYSEIAEIFQLSEAAVRQQISRLLKRLRLETLNR